MHTKYHQYFLPHLKHHLHRALDATHLWCSALDTIFHDAQYLIQNSPSRQHITTTIGVCSHWLRPHQTRWKASGGFAWPIGYKGHPLSRSGLPEYDWYETWRWDSIEQVWSITDKTSPKNNKKRQQMNLSVTFPARTARHQQAVVHTQWTPGSPIKTNEELLEFYAFRKKDEKTWTLEATLHNQKTKQHYELSTQYEQENPQQ